MMDEDDNMESRVTARSAGKENVEPGGYQAYVKTQSLKRWVLKKTLQICRVSLVDSYYEVQLVVVNKLADELRESMTVHMKYEHGLMSEEEFRAYQLSE